MDRMRILGRNIRALASCHAGHVVQRTMPTYFWIEPTNRCNLRCVMCPNGAGLANIPKGDMNLDQYGRILDSIAPYASAVTLAIGGESLLHPDIFTMASQAEVRGIKTHLNTNATLLDQDKAQKMLEAGLTSVSFAFDGFTKEMYENARRGAQFESTLQNILDFLRLKQRRGFKKPYSVLSMLRLGIVDCTDEEKQAFVRQFDGLVDEIRLRDVASWGSTFKDTDDFAIRKHEGVYLPCSRLWNTMSIAWNGNVLPCIYDMNQEYVLGNVHETPIEQIWNNPGYLALRMSMLGGTYLDHMPLCENCIVIGTPRILGIPSGLRLTITDALSNYFGPGIESRMLGVVNRLRGNNFSATRIF